MSYQEIKTAQEKLDEELKRLGWEYSKLFQSWTNKDHSGYSLKIIDGMFFLNQETKFDTQKEFLKTLHQL